MITQNMCGLGALAASEESSGTGIVSEVISIATGVVDSIKDQIFTDSIFIRYRDKVFAIIFANWPRSVYDPILTKYQLGHSSIPDRKIGKTYAPEFERLHQAVAELLNTRKPGWGDTFLAKSKEIAQRYIATDPSRSYKGAPDEALAWVLANPNAVVSSSTATATNSASTGPSTVEASINRLPPDTGRMLMIGAGVLVLGGVAYMATQSKKKNLRGVDGVAKKRKRKKSK